jgi:hypothetical protein
LAAFVVAFMNPGHARAATPAPEPTATASELVKPQSGNDTFKLASLGIVFLVIGAAVVYAPQIVSAISGLPRRLFGSRRKASVKPAPLPQAESTGEMPTTRVQEPESPSIYAPPPVRSERVTEPSEPHDVIARLQSEVRSSWTKGR